MGDSISAGDQHQGSPDLGPALSRIRRRRWCLWAVILIYLPVMGTTVELKWSLQTATMVFALWFGLLFAAAWWVGVARCPRCGNYFHMHGMSYLPLRKCLHCRLPVNADKLP